MKIRISLRLIFRFQVSFEVAFVSLDSASTDPVSIYLNLAIDCLFLVKIDKLLIFCPFINAQPSLQVDVLIQFNTAYFMVDDQGNSILVKDRWRIFLHYGRYAKMM